MKLIFSNYQKSRKLLFNLWGWAGPVQYIWLDCFKFKVGNSNVLQPTSPHRWMFLHTDIWGFPPHLVITVPLKVNPVKEVNWKIPLCPRLKLVFHETLKWIVKTRLRESWKRQSENIVEVWSEPELESL